VRLSADVFVKICTSLHGCIRRSVHFVFKCLIKVRIFLKICVLNKMEAFTKGKTVLAFSLGLFI
jgi:hypothetical protein